MINLNFEIVITNDTNICTKLIFTTRKSKYLTLKNVQKRLKLRDFTKNLYRLTKLFRKYRMFK